MNPAHFKDNFKTHTVVTSLISPTYSISTTSYLHPTGAVQHTTSTSSRSPVFNNKGTDHSSVSSLIIPSARSLEGTTFLAPLKAPKSYGTYTKQQQDEVITFIRDGNSLRTAEKVFGIPKSTMHCWLKKMHNTEEVPTMAEIGTENFLSDAKTDESMEKPVSTVHPFTSKEVMKEKPRTQIIIEEAELVRFLQTNEGAELIAKSYNIAVEEFHGFISQIKYQNRHLKGLLVTPGQKKQVEVVGFVNEQKSPFSDHTVPNTVRSCPTSPHPTDMHRKRDISDEEGNLECHHKKKRVDQPPCSSNRVNLSELVSLLTNSSKKYTVSDSSQQFPRNAVLTSEQIVAANKLISSAQPGAVNTYLATKPFVATNNLLVPSDLNMSIDMKELPKLDQVELSPTYPKITSPVSIKAERIDLDYMMTSPLAAHSQNEQKCVGGRHNTRSINPLKTTKSGTLNLNKINRTQSEKELMALVDEEDVSADELCADFHESLDMTDWIDNEAWYNHQYLQHFQVSPATSCTSKHSDIVQASVSSDVRDEEYEQSAGQTGITFASVQDKEKIVTYLADGNSIEDAERLFKLPQSTISLWLASNTEVCEEIENKPKNTQRRKFESAFFRPSKSLHKEPSNKSAFSKSVSK